MPASVRYAGPYSRPIPRNAEYRSAALTAAPQLPRTAAGCGRRRSSSGGAAPVEPPQWAVLAPSSVSSLRTSKRSSAALSSHTGVSLTARPLLCPGVRGFASPSEEPKKEPSRWEKIKATFREHGPVFVGFYAVTWLGGFGVCWTGVTIAGVDGVALLQYLGADNVFDTSALSPTLVNALIAAEINELGEFVRLPLVIATTPALSRRLKALRR
mmetsp:Transcript_28838/g.87337  ORF Transcript_28838/g.87337 Transcript_28838/m.87337 type:complete len:213 (-) Transcript_28838:69-707(-)